MFRKAVETHNATKPPPKSLAKQLFSSSPPVQQDLKQYQQTAPRPTRPLSVGSNNILRPKPSITNGVKRTSSGLEKALTASAAFEGPKAYPTYSHQNPIVIGDASSVKAQHNKGKAPVDVYFDENDFDSDIDLDVEDPATKKSVAYPKLPAERVSMSRPSLYPTLPMAAPVDTRNINARSDSGYVSQMPGSYQTAPLPPSSEVPIPWSSSPAEHYKTPPKAASLRQYAYQAPDHSMIAPPRPVPPKGQPRPSKRRTLPWLEQQEPAKPTLPRFEEEDDDNTIRMSELTSIKSAKAVKNSDGHFTPLPKNRRKASYPWNTTASAMKEQQKTLRQANKKLVKTNEATQEGLKKSKARALNLTVQKVFLSEEQQHVLGLVVDKKKSVFFTGSAGTGKSVLLREIISSLRKKYQREPDRVAVTASTGLAACNVGGVTVHSFAGIGLGKEPVDELVKKIKRNQKAKHRWMRTKVLVVDEVSMVDGDLFDKLEEIARRMRNNGRPFGGIQLVITGDFFQLPPVPDSGKVAKFAFDAATWATSIEHTIGLHKVFRQADPVFAGMLNEMREGRLTEASINIFKRLDRNINIDGEMEATELFPTRSEVDAANNERMRRLVGDVKVFEAKDGGSVTDVSFRDKLLQNCMAPDRIHLKKGAQVMLIKNIDDTLVNGSLGKVSGFMNEQTFDRYLEHEEEYVGADGELSSQAPADLESKPRSKIELMRGNKMEQFAQSSAMYPVVRFAIADGTTRDLLCTRETWKVELPNGEVQASRAQVPLILAWALSIHKAQGQTLARVKVDLGKVFEKGQAYVALSRATSMKGLQILRFDPRKVVAHDKVRTFYDSLTRAEQTGRRDDGGGNGKSAGLSAQDHERGFVEDIDDVAAEYMGYR